MRRSRLRSPPYGRTDRSLLLLCGAFGLALSCTNDFGQFNVDEPPGGGGRDGAAMDGSVNGGSGGDIGGFGGSFGASSGSGGTGGAGQTPDGASPESGTGGSVEAGTGGATEAGAGGAVGCASGTKDCSGLCVPITPDVGCDAPACTACSFPNATAECVSGACALGPCTPGWTECNTNEGDGCEQRTDTVVAHCGACNRGCNTSSVASLACSGGLCTSTCSLGRGNCVQPPTGADDGCETDVTADPLNCGGCDNNCTVQSGSFVCINSLCACNANGQCGNQGTCTGGLCVCNANTCRPGERCQQGGAGACRCNGGTPCGAAQVCCQTPGGCRDLSSAPDSCGACGRACPCRLRVQRRSMRVRRRR